MSNGKKLKPEWVNRDKSISQLIEELQSFEDQSLEVQISIDDGESRKPISLVKKNRGVCLLVFCGDEDQS